MEIINNDNNREKVIGKAKESYVRIGHIWCPALKDHIAFDDAGFHHLIWKNRKHRSRTEQKRRFRLLPSAERVIAQTKLSIAYQEREIMFLKKKYGEAKIEAAHASFWGLKEERDDQTITVVIRQVDSGDKHFYSIFDKEK